MFERSFPVSSYGAFATLLWLAWVTPPLLFLLFLIKALGLDLKDLWCSSSSPSLWYSLPLSFSQSVVSVSEGLCGAGGRSIRSVPPSRALCSEEPQRMKSSPVIYEIRVFPGSTWLWSYVAGQEGGWNIWSLDCVYWNCWLEYSTGRERVTSGIPAIPYPDFVFLMLKTLISLMQLVFPSGCWSRKIDMWGFQRWAEQS